MERATFTIHGTPRPQGSLKIVTSRSTGRAFAKNSDTTTEHRNLLVATIGSQWEDTPITGAVQLWATFVMPRPASHYGTGRNADRLKPSAPFWHTGKPDGDKLIRAVFDALTIAGVVRDDCVIDRHHAAKRWQTDRGDRPRTEVIIDWERTA